MILTAGVAIARSSGMQTLVNMVVTLARLPGEVSAHAGVPPGLPGTFWGFVGDPLRNTFYYGHEFVFLGLPGIVLAWIVVFILRN